MRQGHATGDLAGASVSVRDLLPRVLPRLRRAAGLLALTAALAACAGSGLSSAEWAWCKQNPAAVDAAAATLQIPTAQQSFKEPTWWQDYLITVASQNNAGLMANPDFTASCKAAADKAGVDEANVAWCATDGIGESWDAAVSLALMSDVDADTYAYRALPLLQRINNADFDRACQAAYKAR
jgi:hypothetical protein